MTTDDERVVQPDAALLRSAGLRVTAVRQAVLAALQVGAHADAAEVFALARRDVPGTSLQAVYNALADLGAADLIRRIEPAGQTARWERRIGDNHHHLVCTSCGAISDVDCVVGSAPCLTPSSTGGFQVSAAEVTFWGLCATCQTVDASDLPTNHTDRTTHSEGTAGQPRKGSHG